MPWGAPLAAITTGGGAQPVSAATWAPGLAMVAEQARKLGLAPLGGEMRLEWEGRDKGGG